MTKILGIHESHDSGAAIVVDGKIVAAVNEERLLRKKLFMGLPAKSINEVFRIACVSPGEIDNVAIAGITPGGGAQIDPIMNRTERRKIMDIASHVSFIFGSDAFIKLYRIIFSKFNPHEEVIAYIHKLGVNAPVTCIDHHLAHAASAFYTSDFDNDSIIVTTDSSGDGISSSINIVTEDFNLRRVSNTPFYHSPAAVYGYTTYNMGYTPSRHEGKLTGLAAYGNPTKTYTVYKKVFEVNGLKYKSKLGCWGVPAQAKLHRLLQGYKREDIAAGLQKRFEDVCSLFVRNALSKYPASNVAMAGGAFANVKLNQCIAEIPKVNKVYIHPHMGDGGLATGAALALWADLMLDEGKKPKPHPINNVYFGPEYSNDEIEESLEDAGLRYDYHSDIELEIAQLIADKKIVGRFNGPMEYGPRALGNRSILADPMDETINDWLNKRLHRTEFMPFAPSLMREHAEEFYKHFEVGEIAAKFMTITFDVNDEGVKRAPAVVHVDNTARPQTVTREQNESYYKILKAYYEITGLPIFVNTSFNMHEEPIVCSPNDAIRAFRLGSVDVLAIGNYIVKQD